MAREPRYWHVYEEGPGGHCLLKDKFEYTTEQQAKAQSGECHTLRRLDDDELVVRLLDGGTTAPGWDHIGQILPSSLPVPP